MSSTPGYARLMLGISAEALWDGAIGSLAAAFIGGLVALGVTWLTNRHQSRLAAEAREKAAIADFLAGADLLLAEYGEGERAIEGFERVMAAASIRWQMELSDPDMAFEVMSWPHHLGELARRAYAAERAGSRHSPEGVRLDKAVQDMRYAALGWPKATPERRKFFRENLSGLRSNPQNFTPPPQ